MSLFSNWFKKLLHWFTGEQNETPFASIPSDQDSSTERRTEDVTDLSASDSPSPELSSKKSTPKIKTATKPAPASRKESRSSTKEIESVKKSSQAVQKAESLTTVKRTLSAKDSVIHIQVGVDFGTSSTKIVYKELKGRTVNPIVFKSKNSFNPGSCVPSVIAVDKQRSLLYGFEAADSLKNDWNDGIRQFKMLLAGTFDRKFLDPLTEKNYFNYLERHQLSQSQYGLAELTSAYLAFVFLEVRSYLAGLPQFKKRELNLIFNVCVPIDYMKHNHVMQGYEQVFAVADKLYQDISARRIRGDLLEQARDLLSSKIKLPDEARRVYAVPEAAAQVVSYLSSLEKQPWLHAVIDFGQGTTDISIFNLLTQTQHDEITRHQFVSVADILRIRGEDENEELIPWWYSASNIPWGTLQADRAFFASTKNGKPAHSLVKFYDLFHKPSHKTPIEVFTKFQSFWDSDEYGEAWKMAYNRLKLMNYWEKVNLLFCGGGSRWPGISKIFDHPWLSALEQDGITYKVQALPSPADYNGTEEAPFYRMSVAYGLSRPLPEIEPWIKGLPKDFPNDTPPPPPTRKYDFEDLYSK